jgi:type IV pilus assembly protein PilN
MIRINLLPHREEKRKARRQQFFVLTGLVAVLAGLIVFLGYSVISGYITTQDERNDFLKKEIAVLDKQLEEIKRLKEQTAALLSRKQIIESLQSDRAEAVYLLNEMAKLVPEGVYLKSLKQEGRNVTVSGYTQSNARVSTLMRNLDASPWLERPVLGEIKAATTDKRRVSEFTLTVSLTRAPAVVEDKSGAQVAGAKK